jgi:hypothetical protein
MIMLQRLRQDQKDKVEFIFVNPNHVVVIVPREDGPLGPACDVGLSNATSWAIQSPAEKLANKVWGALSGARA